MRNIQLLLALVALFCTSVVTSAQDTLNRALLWRLDVPGAPAPSYLFGTIHLIDGEDFLLSDSLMQALNRSEQVVFEIDPGKMMDMGNAMGMMQMAMIPGGKSLRDLYTEEEYARVDKHFSEMGLPMMFMERIKPMFLSMLANMDMSDLSGMMGGAPADEDAEGGEGMKSYELELNKLATGADKAVGGLETVDFQMSLFDSIPLDAQADMLLEAIDNPEGADALAEITKVYVTGDIEGMYRMSVGDEGGLGGHERTLIVNRNRNWVAPMLAHAATGPTLFAVGAGHLGGPEGVIRLLREKGVEVTALSVR